MKLKVLKVFSDKYTNELYKVNDVLEVSEERAKEILNHQLELVEKIEETNGDKIVNQIVNDSIEEFKQEQEIEAKAILEDLIELEAKEIKPKQTRKKKKAQ